MSDILYSFPNSFRLDQTVTPHLQQRRGQPSDSEDHASRRDLAGRAARVSTRWWARHGPVCAIGDDRVAACEDKVGTRQAGLIRFVDDHGAIAEEAARAGGRGEIEIEVAV